MRRSQKKGGKRPPLIVFTPGLFFAAFKVGRMGKVKERARLGDELRWIVVICFS